MRPRSARAWVLPASLLVGALVAAGAALAVWPAPPPPQVGLAALDSAHDLDTSRGISGEDFWLQALDDFDRALADVAALRRYWVPVVVPDRWRSGRWLARGMVARHRRQFRTARRAFERALAIEPHWALAHVQRSRILLKLHDDAGALAAARQACAEEPTWPAAQLALGHALEAQLATFDRRGWSRVLDVLRRAVALSAGRPRTRAYALADLAQALHVSGNASAADRTAREALAVRSDLLAAHLVLAEQALARADGVAAQLHAEQAESLDARDARIELALAEALALQSDRAAALEHYRYAVELEREDGYTGADPDWMRQVQEALRAGHLPAPYFSSPAPAPAPEPATP